MRVHGVVEGSALADRSAPVEWRAWPLYCRPPISSFSLGRVALVGDAAHPMVPFLAQGAAQAIEDAGALARALAQVARHPGGPLDVLARSRGEGGSSSTRSAQTGPHLSSERPIGVRSGYDDALAWVASPSRALRLALRRLTPARKARRALSCKRRGSSGATYNLSVKSGSGTASCVHAADGRRRLEAHSPRRSRPCP